MREGRRVGGSEIGSVIKLAVGEAARNRIGQPERQNELQYARLTRIPCSLWIITQLRRGNGVVLSSDVAGTRESRLPQITICTPDPPATEFLIVRLVPFAASLNGAVRRLRIG